MPQMKKSLEILNITSSSLEEVSKKGPKKKNDDDISNELNNLTIEDQEEHLRKLLEKKPHGFVKSKRLLANFVRSKDLKLAFEMIMSACLSAPTDAENYFLLAEIAIENKAWNVAKEALEITRWLCHDNQNELINKSDSLLLAVLEKITNKEVDNSKNDFWYNRMPDKFWILEKLYLQANTKELVRYSFDLITLFSKDIKNYEVAYKAFVIAQQNEALENFLLFINEKLSSDELNKNLFSGMVYFYFKNYSLAVEYLQKALKLSPLNSKVLFYLSLSYLNMGNTKIFTAMAERILPDPEPTFSALFFAYSAICGFDMGTVEFPNHKLIAKEVSKIVEKLIENNQLEIVSNIEDQFKKLNYKLVLPCLNLYLSELYIKKNEIKKAKQYLENENDPEVHRLKSWISRIERNESQAENELYEYRKSWIPDKETGIHCQSTELELPNTVPKNTNEVFAVIESAYTQTKKLTEAFELEYAINPSTCMEAGCQDCCKKTFPMVSYSEYLYLRSWFDKQTEGFKKGIEEYSKSVLLRYKETFNKEAPFMVGENIVFHKEYPLNFSFDCPFLGDNKCNIHEVRPFGCRAYGYSSYDGITFKGCNYLFEQFKSATKMHHVRKVIDATSFYKYISLSDKVLIDQKVMAPLPRWFAQDYDETVRLIKDVINQQIKA